MEEIKELLETKQYTGLRQKLTEYNDADIAAILEELSPQDMIKVFRILPRTPRQTYLHISMWIISRRSSLHCPIPKPQAS